MVTAQSCMCQLASRINSHISNDIKVWRAVYEPACTYKADNNIINTAIRYGFVANPWIWSVSVSCKAWEETFFTCSLHEVHTLASQFHTSIAYHLPPSPAPPPPPPPFLFIHIDGRMVSSLVYLKVTSRSLHVAMDVKAASLWSQNAHFSHISIFTARFIKQPFVTLPSPRSKNGR